MDAKVSKFLKQGAVGAVVGAMCGAGFVHFFLDEEAPLALPEMHEAAALVAVMLFAMGLIVLGMSFSARQVAEAYGGEFEEGEDYREEAADVRAQGLVSLLAGVEMAVLAIGPAPLRASPVPFLAALAILLFAQTWINIRIWKRGDEYLRRLLVEIGVISFAVFQFALFLWVVAVQFGAAPEPSALDVYTAMMALYLVVSMVVGSRVALGLGRTGTLTGGEPA